MMRSSIPLNIVVDTGFWFALYDENDNYYVKATQYVKTIEKSTVLIPWPCLYEVFNTRFARNHLAVNQFEIFLKRPNTRLIDDVPYREAALVKTIALAMKKRYISLVDMIVQQILQDVSLKIDYLITFNERDFSEICRRRKIPIYYGE